MDRREALKNLGVSLGYAVATPTLLGIVQSCKTENVSEWTPDFFTMEEGVIITQLVDIILPKTDTPSATEVQVDLFIDRFADQVLFKEEQDLLRMTMGQFIDKALVNTTKENVLDLAPNELETVLKTSLGITNEEQKANDGIVENYMRALDEGAAIKLDAIVARNAFAKNLRNMTILGYKSAEYIGEEVLGYLPVPGEYVACGTAEELTGGKAWSL